MTRHAQALSTQTTRDGRAWVRQAACASCGLDPEVWSLSNKRSAVPEHLADICRACPVRRQCLDDALATNPTDDHDVRAGLNPHDRHRLRMGRPVLPTQTLNLTGTKARHGSAPTYARGCRCEICVEATHRRNQRKRAS